MIILDCESLDSTIASLANLCGMSDAMIRSVLTDFDLERFLTDHPHHPAPPSKIVMDALARSMTQPPTIDRAYWFHLSRVTNPKCFEAGIFPLDAQLIRIWEDLERLAVNLVSIEDWHAFRSGAKRTHSHHGGLYGMKVRDRMHWGPFAILVREAAFRSREIGNHDYLATPEIVEDICMSFKATFGIDLLTIFEAHSRPCIVKFWEDCPHEGVVSAAINYAYAVLHGNELSIDTNTCFDGRAIPITPARIIGINEIK
jgi:hypothetical protein